MPLPTPKRGEKQAAFISRCMGNSQAKKDFPKQDQRLGVCHSQWRAKKNEEEKENKNMLRQNKNFRLMAVATETVREETFQDKAFTVVPVIALVEGVLQAANSPQPELVKAEEFEPQAWNGRPVTFNHPDIAGTLVSASVSPELFEQVAVGTIFNAEVLEGKKLRVEAWIQNDKVEDQGDLAVQAFERIKNNETVEISTGYFADSIPTKGKFNGEEFDAVQRNIKPDHLAILTGEAIGACSIEDGCGAPRVNEAGINECECQTGEDMPETITDQAKHLPDEDKKVKKKVGKKNQGEEEDEDEEQDKDKEDKTKTNMSYSEMVENLPHFHLQDNQDISDMDTRRAIMSALEAKGQSFWGVVAVFSNSFVFEKDFGTLEKRDFSIADDGTVTIAEEGEVVRPVTEFVPVVANELNQDNNSEFEENKMAVEVTKETKEQVTALITNEKTEYKEEDREFLEGLEEKQLKVLTAISDHQGEGEAEGEDEKAPAEGEGEKAPAESENEKAPESEEGDPPPVTAAEYIAKAPTEIQGVLNQGMKLQAAERSELIESIMTNKDSSFSVEELQSMSTEHLDKMSKMASPTDYTLRGGPKSNVREDSNLVPPMKEIWPRKQSA